MFKIRTKRIGRLLFVLLIIQLGFLDTAYSLPSLAQPSVVNQGDPVGNWITSSHTANPNVIVPIDGTLNLTAGLSPGSNPATIRGGTLTLSQTSGVELGGRLELNVLTDLLPRYGDEFSIISISPSVPTHKDHGLFELISLPIIRPQVLTSGGSGTLTLNNGTTVLTGQDGWQSGNLDGDAVLSDADLSKIGKAISGGVTLSGTRPNTQAVTTTNVPNTQKFDSVVRGAVLTAPPNGRTAKVESSCGSDLVTGGHVLDIGSLTIHKPTVNIGTGGTLKVNNGGVISLASGETYSLDAGQTIDLGTSGTLSLGTNGATVPGNAGTLTLTKGGSFTLGSGEIVTLAESGTLGLNSTGAITLSNLRSIDPAASSILKVNAAPTPPPMPESAVVRVAQINHEPWLGLDLEQIDPNWDIESVQIEPLIDPNTGTLIFDVFNPTGVFEGTTSSGVIISSGTIGLGGGLIFHSCAPPPPIELLNSDQSIEAKSNAVVRVVDESYDASNIDVRQAPKDKPFESELAIAAGVFDPNGEFVSGALALANQSSHITTTRMTANGAVTAEGLLDSGVPDGDANASATSDFFSAFRLNQGHEFNLAIEVSATENVSIAVSLEDDITGHIIFEADPALYDQETGAWEIELEGFLPPGEYTIRAEALSDAAIHSDGALNLGGQAAFDLQLDLTTIASSSESVFLTSLIPEPTTLAIFAFAFSLLGQRRHRAA